MEIKGSCAIHVLKGSKAPGPACTGKDGATIAVSDNIKTPSVRIIARDRAGRERRQRTGNIARTKEFRQTTAEFPLDRDRVQEFRLQVQPLIDAAVKGIALSPNGGKYRVAKAGPTPSQPTEFADAL